jgi:2-succinyl-6-hydroxy-2,4-cyclohexadiene-1-carboxylate synthase
MARDIVLLHGFAGTGAAWDPVRACLDEERYRALALDLPGHGSAPDVRPVTFEACVQHVLAAAPQRFVLGGYSMGGRVALHVALAAPERVDRLVLISTTAGIEDAGERASRTASDEALAARTEAGTIGAFADAWAAQPLFAGTPPDAAAEWRADMERNDPVALAAVLRGIGTGSMEPLWNRLAELSMPVTVVVGEEDERFLAFGRRLAESVRDGEIVVVPGAGHGLPREAPQALAEVLAG